MTVGAIMAGGQGSRLKVMEKPKPLVEIGGRPLIAHVLEQLREARVRHTFIDTTGTPDDLLLFIENHGPVDMTIEIIHGSGSSGTAGAVERLLSAASGEPCLVSTVDTVAPRFSYDRLRRYCESGDRVISLGMLATTAVHDEMPIWVHVDNDGATVTDFGKEIEPADRCFGNVRWFSNDAARMFCEINRQSTDRDTKVMRVLVKTLAGQVKQITIDPIFDIDTREDLALATSWWRDSTGPAGAMYNA